MNPRLPRRRGARRLQLWPISTVLILIFTVATVTATVAFYNGWDLPGGDSKNWFDLLKASFGLVAGAGALFALVIAYRRQRIDEETAMRDATRLHVERFSSAVSLLGENSAAVHLSGVHTLAGLADDAPTSELRQTCIDTLCAYLRLPYTTEVDLPANDAEARRAYLALREVRHTIIRLIRDHLRLEDHHSWQGHDFDFTSAVFDGGDFRRVVFSGGRVDFSGAVFSGGRVDFSGAVFSGGTVDFSGATGQAPYGLIQAAGSPLPVGLILADAWQPGP